MAVLLLVLLTPVLLLFSGTKMVRRLESVRVAFFAFSTPMMLIW